MLKLWLVVPFPEVDALAETNMLCAPLMLQDWCVCRFSLLCQSRPLSPKQCCQSCLSAPKWSKKEVLRSTTLTSTHACVHAQVTAGIVSCVERRGHELGLPASRSPYIQTDVAINQVGCNLLKWHFQLLVLFEPACLAVPLHPSGYGHQPGRVQQACFGDFGRCFFGGLTASGPLTSKRMWRSTR